MRVENLEGNGIVTEASSINQISSLIEKVNDKMDERFNKLKEVHCSSIQEYNSSGNIMEYITLVVDYCREIKLKVLKNDYYLERILRLGRATGIQVVLE